MLTKGTRMYHLGTMNPSLIYASYDLEGLELEPIPAGIGCKVGFTLDRLWVGMSLDYTGEPGESPHTNTRRTGNQYSNWGTLFHELMSKDFMASHQIVVEISQLDPVTTQHL